MELLGDAGHDPPESPLERELDEENRRLRRICQALMERVESAGVAGAPYAAFEHAVMLAEQVRERTDTLHRTLDQLAEANRRLEQARLEAEAANQSKTRFLAAVSHDLLQPLNAARLFTSALEDHRSLDPETAPLVQRIARSLRDVELLLGTLVDISRLDAGVLTADPAPFAISELLDALAEEFRQAAAVKALTLHYVPSSAVVVSDLPLLARVLRNLLSNAVRYTSQGRILLGCRRRGDALEVVVADTGPGIDEPMREEVFIEFRRGQADQSELEPPGLGLGLAIVERITRLLDHPLSLVTQSGRGACFSVCLPRVPGSRPLLTAGLRQRLEGEDKLVGAPLWVLDNDPAILDGMQALLSGWGCQVLVAERVLQLEQQLVASARDRGAGSLSGVVLVDYHLAGGDGDGLSLIQRLTHDYPALKPVLITANHDADIKRRCRKGDIPCLLKPIKPLRLRQTLIRLLSPD